MNENLKEKIENLKMVYETKVQMIDVDLEDDNTSADRRLSLSIEKENCQNIATSLNQVLEFPESEHWNLLARIRKTHVDYVSSIDEILSLKD